MGKSYSKTEDKEIIIAQTAGAGKNSATDSETESHGIELNNALLITILVLIGIGIMVFIYKKFKARQQSWMRKTIQEEFVRRLQLRLSGRGRAAAATETDEDRV